MANAGVKAVACISDLHARGSNLVIEVLRGNRVFAEWEHYPSGDVRDSESHTQYYFHAHPPEESGTIQTTGISIYSCGRKGCLPELVLAR
jgi:Domain of unknown function (DUF6969)